MKHKKIYVNGSSYSDGYGMCKKDFLKVLHKHNPLYPNPNLPKEERVEFRKKNCWPGQLQKLVSPFRVEVINEAGYGGSFSRCVRMCFEYILTQENPSETLYILEIPNSDRYDLYSTDKRQHLRVGGTDMEFQHELDGITKTKFSKLEYKAIEYLYGNFGHESNAWRREVLQMINFGSFLKSQNCDFLFIPMEQSFMLGHQSLLYSKYIENFKDNFVKFKLPNDIKSFGSLCESNFNEENVTDNILAYVNEMNYNFKSETNGELEDKHITLEGNKEVANNVYKKITERWLIDFPKQPNENAWVIDFRQKLVEHNNTNQYIVVNQEYTLVQIIEIMRSFDFKIPLCTISITEAHQQFQEQLKVLEQIRNEVENYKFYYIGNYIEDKIYKNKTNELHQLKLNWAPFSGFTQHPLWCEETVDDVCAYNMSKTLEDKKVNSKSDTVSCLMFGRSVVRDYLWVKLCENDLINLTTYHSFEKDGKTFFSTHDTLEEFNNYGIGKFLEYDRYLKYKSLLPKEIDVTPPEKAGELEISYMDGAVSISSKALFNIVSETTFGWNKLYTKLTERKIYPKGCMTEKTMLPFISCSIPLILHDDNKMIKNHFIKNGIDMFTDIIPDSFYNGYFTDKVDVIIEFLKNFKDDENVVFEKIKHRLYKNKKMVLEKGNLFDDIIGYLK